MLWRELRYRWLPWLVFASLLATMGFLWYHYLTYERLPVRASNPLVASPGVIAETPVLPRCSQIACSSNGTERAATPAK